MNLRLSVDVPTRDVAYTAGCEIREAVKKKFDKEGIEILYPYSNLVIQNQEDSPSQNGGLANEVPKRDPTL